MRTAPSVRTAGIALCVAAAIVSTGCKDDDPLAAIDRFEKNRLKALEKMNALEARYANCSVPTNPATTDEFAEDWKKRWGGVEKEVTRLKSELTTVITVGDKRFKKMYDMADSIRTPELRASALAKNNTQAQAWSAVIKEANGNVAKMEGQVSLARDIYTVLKLDSMRSETESKIVEIRMLNGQMKAIVAELSKVTAEGRTLLR